MAELACGNREDALDIVQDAMLDLARKYAHKPAGEWMPLFQRILQSRIRDWYRRQKVRNRWRTWLRRDDEEADPDPLQNIPDPGGRSPLEQAEQDHDMERLGAALQRLPLRQQQAFLLRVWEGLDVAQTAAAMGCSPGSVKTHYSRAIHSLREVLGES